MPILVDGHNLIGQMPNIDLADPDDERQLVLILRQYATGKRKRRVEVVFDGGTYGNHQNLNGYGVVCHFVKSPGNADRELIKRIRKIRRTGEWMVVTSDRAVAGEARAHGVRVMRSEEFARRLLTPEEPNVRTEDKHRDRPLSKREVEEWLRIFGIEEDEEDDEPLWRY